MDPLRTSLKNVLGLPASADDTVVLAKVKELMKRHTGKDVELMAQREVNQLALQAQTYMAKMAASGVTIDISTAVRAVRDGKAIL